ncbi:unnamed protein product [Symbiodinium sp. CCMP2592]|nr:unnamed protein product [Symbiodinium sp. CCMP2592]
MFTAVRDKEIPRDKRGHPITNGAEGVLKTKKKDGKTVELQRFISILCPTNDAMRLLPGAQDTLPYIGQLTARMVEKDSYLVLDSEDFQSTFNLFKMPLRWAGFFAFAKKVRGDALGLSRDAEVRSGLTVVLMVWTSVVTLIQAAIRFISYDIGKVPSLGDMRKDRPISETDAQTVLYYDNFDELRHLKKEILSEALDGTLQGGEVLGKERILRHAYEKSRELTDMGLGLLSIEMKDEFCLRHWTGKAAFAAAFKRPMFSILQEGAALLPQGQIAFVAPAYGGHRRVRGVLKGVGYAGPPEISLPTPVWAEALLPQVLQRPWLRVLSEMVARSGFSLSKAAGLKGIETQEPMDYGVPGDRWDFKTDFGKARLEEEEDDGDLMGTHWAPDRFTFCRIRRRGFWNDRHQWDHGLPALRSHRFSEGLSQLRRQDNVAVRQANAMAKRAAATRYLQDATAVDWAVTQCVKFLDSMDSGQVDRPGQRYGWEPAWTVRCLPMAVAGCAFIQMEAVAAHQCPGAHGVLGRAQKTVQGPGATWKRFFCIVDSLVTFYVLGKGRSSSKRLNRICRRITAISLATGLIPITLWTISKWNFSDGASRPHLLTSQLFLRNWHRVHMPKRTSPISWLGAKAMAAAAAQLKRFDLALLVFLDFAFFLRAMELLNLSTSHVRLFPEEGTVVAAILGAKTSKGLQQSLSLRDPSLVRVLQFLMDRVRPRDRIYSKSVSTFRLEFSSLVTAIGLDPADYLPYCLRRGGATWFYQQHGLGRTVIQGRWKDQNTARIYVDDARAILIQLLLPARVTARQTYLASFWRVASPEG